MKPMWIVFENSRPMDQARAYCSTEARAYEVADHLNDTHPRSDGFYVEEASLDTTPAKDASVQAEESKV